MAKPRVFVMDPSGDRRSIAASVLRFRRWRASLLAPEAASSVPHDTAVVLAVEDATGAAVHALRQVRRACPGAARILVCEPSVGARAVARGEPAHQVVVTPATAEKTMAAVRRALRVRDLVADPHVRAVAQSLGSLPAMPRTWRALNELLESEQATMQDAVALVERDVGLSAKVLQLVNTGMFGLDRHIGSLFVALQRLGLQAIRDLVLSVELMESLDQRALPPEIAPLPLQSLSYLVAHAARAVSPRAGVEIAFTAGLFHQVGRLVFATKAQELFARVVQQVAAGSNVGDAEQAVFGLDSRLLSAWLLASWGLPHEVVEAVRWCDRPDQAQGRGAPLALSVFLAARLVEEAAWERATGSAPMLVSRADLAPWGLSGSLEGWRKHVRGLLTQHLDTDQPEVRAS